MLLLSLYGQGAESAGFSTAKTIAEKLRADHPDWAIDIFDTDRRENALLKSKLAGSSGSADRGYCWFKDKSFKIGDNADFLSYLKDYFGIEICDEEIAQLQRDMLQDSCLNDSVVKNNPKEVLLYFYFNDTMISMER